MANLSLINQKAFNTFMANKYGKIRDFIERKRNKYTQKKYEKLLNVLGRWYQMEEIIFKQ